jgi:hypothetical protein
MHPALALLQVDRVRGQVPVDHRVTVGVEVEPLLSDGGRRQDERPEWELKAARKRPARVGSLLSSASWSPKRIANRGRKRWSNV